MLLNRIHNYIFVLDKIKITLYIMRPILFVVLAALSVFLTTEAASIDGDLISEADSIEDQGVSGRYDLIEGNIGSGDRLLFRKYYKQNAKPKEELHEDFTFRDRKIRITAIEAREVGQTQWATARVLKGGINQNFAEIRLKSRYGSGYHYKVEIYGRNV
ncbi:unnamed protein product [Chrysodeixis includens]|uniref:Uncharacterized protein n=1 Tax=Chrysodeixis includens TaxID=689277 RepID=A0A9P0BTT8_CHRIL|nr:unnamed protein product [Chrysodeixis includens]